MGGVSDLTVLGMMGEAPKLTAQQSATFVQAELDRVAGSVPVVVGVSAAASVAMGSLSASVMDMGAAGVMVASPFTVRTDDQIVSYFHGVAETPGAAPFVLQDFPLTTKPAMSQRFRQEK